MPLPGRGMGSGRRKFWALCLLLLLPEAGSAKNIWKRASHARLAEKPRVSARGRGGREAAGDPQARAGRHVQAALERLLVCKRRSEGHSKKRAGGAGGGGGGGDTPLPTAVQSARPETPRA